MSINSSALLIIQLKTHTSTATGACVAYTSMQRACIIISSSCYCLSRRGHMYSEYIDSANETVRMSNTALEPFRHIHTHVHVCMCLEESGPERRRRATSKLHLERPNPQKNPFHCPILLPLPIGDRLRRASCISKGASPDSSRHILVLAHLRSHVQKGDAIFFIALALRRDESQWWI